MKRMLIVFCILGLCVFSARAESPEEREITPKGYVALTFDDGPSGALTQRLLDGLKARGARATFFLCGYRMEQYPDLLSRYVAEGHEVGIHSTVHANLTALSPKELHDDLKYTAQQIFIATGRRPLLMRPPGGAWDESVRREAAMQELSVILWSVDPKDWAGGTADTVLAAMSQQTQNGDIVLLHDLSERSVTAALHLVDDLQQAGYSFVTVSELAALTDTVLIPGGLYRNFSPS